MFDFFSKYLKDQNGATAIEYGLIAAGIGLAIASTTAIMGADIAGFFTTLSTHL